MKLLAIVALASTVLSDRPKKSEVYIEGLITGGSGCKQGTVASSLSKDLQSFTLLFDDFVASTGSGTTAKDSRKNCQINIDLRYPQGWSYSVLSVDYRGFIDIPSGVSATQSATYYFSGQTAQNTYSSTTPGPYTGNYLYHDEVGTEALVWSPCGSVVQGNINSQVYLTGDKSKNAQITTDSIDGKYAQIYGIQWKRC